MADEIGEIRARIDIVDLVESAGVVLKRSGKNYTGLCPFHTDKNPSFSVNPSFGSYRCYACGEKGDIFNWVMKTQNVDFPEALRILAERAGVTLSDRKRPDGPSRSQREAQLGAMEEALRFFRQELGRHKAPQDYCERRGLSQEVLDTWELGYAPDLDNALGVALKKAGFALAEAKELFLVDGDASGYRDKFRGRLIFPIRDERGDLVAFGGRLLGDGHPKYINSSDTPLYRKSKVLYGLYQARNRVMKERHAVLAEGYMDVIACHRAGLTHAMASLGTSLAEDQAKLLKRWCDRVTILYDGDAAGQKAADRAVDILRAAQLPVTVALLPAGKDPDDILNTLGAEGLKRVVEGGIGPLEFRLLALEAEHGIESPEYWQEAPTIIAQATSALEAESFIDRLAPQYPGTRDAVMAKRALHAEVRKAKMAARASRSRSDTSAPVAATLATVMASKLGSSELTLFHAYLSGFHRDRVHGLLTDGELFQTAVALNLAAAIASTFSEGAPTGEPVLWLHHLPIEIQDFINAENFDRLGELSERLLDDSIANLTKARDKRNLRSIDESENRLKTLHDRLQRMKPDPRRPTRSDQ